MPDYEKISITQSFLAQEDQLFPTCRLDLEPEDYKQTLRVWLSSVMKVIDFQRQRKRWKFLWRILSQRSYYLIERYPRQSSWVSHAFKYDCNQLVSHLRSEAAGILALHHLVDRVLGVVDEEAQANHSSFDEDAEKAVNDQWDADRFVRKREMKTFAEFFIERTQSGCTRHSNPLPCITNEEEDEDETLGK